MHCKLCNPVVLRVRLRTVICVQYAALQYAPAGPSGSQRGVPQRNWYLIGTLTKLPASFSGLLPTRIPEQCTPLARLWFQEALGSRVKRPASAVLTSTMQNSHTVRWRRCLPRAQRHSFH